MKAGRFILNILFVLAIPVGIFVFPKAFPYIVGGFMYFIFGFAALILLLVFGALAWRRWFPESFGRSGITIRERSPLGFVGSEGAGSSLRIEDAPEGLRVEWARTDYAFLLLGMGFFGPGIILLYVFWPEKFNHHLPVAVIVAVVGLVIAVCFAFINILCTWLWKRPRLAVTAQSIELFQGPKSIRTIWRHQLSGLKIEDHMYRSDHGHLHPNYILTAVLDGGENFRLCISDKKEQIEQLQSIISQRMGISAAGASPPPPLPTPPAPG